MTDWAELKRLAERVGKEMHWHAQGQAFEDFREAAMPDAILALIAENERLSVVLLEIASVNPAQRGIEWAKSVAGHASGGGNELYQAWLAAFEERDQLRAEVEALRKDAERYRFVRQNGDTLHWENMLHACIGRDEDIDSCIDAAMSKEKGNGEV